MTFIQIGAAQKQSHQQFHNGLPQGWNRDRFRQLCVQYAQIKGCKAECVRTLEIIIDMIPPKTFTDVDTEPYCYARQDSLIGGRMLTAKSIFNHERQLEELGLIERRLGANGSRCSRKKLGLYLTPALDLLPEMMEAAAQRRAEREAHDTLRGDRSRLLKHVKVSFETLAELGIGNKRIEALCVDFMAWPRSDKLLRLSLQALEHHVEAARVLLMELMQIIQDSQALPDKISGQPEAEFGCHIQDYIEDKLMSCNSAAVDKQSSAKASDSGSFRDTPDGASNCLEKQNGEPSEQGKPNLLLPRISNTGLYAIASEEMRMHIDIAGGGEQDSAPSLYAIETGVWTRLSEIGTNISAWHEALEAMGLLGAIVAGVLTDAKLSDPKHPVANPGGYFRGMTRAAQKDELNLIAGWMGLVARRTKEEEDHRV